MHMCKGLELMLKEGFITGGNILHMETGEEAFRPVLRRLKEGKDGRLIVTRDWCHVNYCPACGELMQA